MSSAAIEPASSHVPRSLKQSVSAIFARHGVALFVWGVWALTVLTALAFVLTYGTNIPYFDDWWGWLMPLVKRQPITISWLWSPHANVGPHRCPLPRLLLLGLYLATGDMGWARVFSVLLLGALAFAMILTARRLRGRLSSTDAFFPLVLLNLGHTLNLLWVWALTFTLPAFLIGVMLLAIVSSNSQPRLGAVILAGICLFLLPLCQAMGVLVVPALALWLGYVAVMHRLAGGRHARRESLLILGFAVATALLLVLYFIGLPSSRSSESLKLEPVLIVRTMLQFLGVGTFSASYTSWPRPLRAVGQLVSATLFLISTVLVILAILRKPDERTRALGLLAFQGAMACIVLGIGIGRPGAGGVPRYAIMLAPALCGLYFIWVLYGPPAIGRVVTVALLVCELGLALPNLHYGVAIGKAHKYIMASFERDLRSGMPTYMLLGRYGRFLSVDRALLQDAQRNGFGIFRALQGDPELREVPLVLKPVVVHDLAWQNGIGKPIGPEPYIIFELPEFQFVGGVRLKYSHDPPQGANPEPLRMSWSEGPPDHFTRARTRIRWNCQAPGEESVTTWVAAMVKQLRIGLDTDEQTYAWRISEITLLLPVQDDRFTHLVKDLAVQSGPQDAHLENDENLKFFSAFEDNWSIGLFQTVPEFVNDVLSRGRL